MKHLVLGLSLSGGFDYDFSLQCYWYVNLSNSSFRLERMYFLRIDPCLAGYTICRYIIFPNSLL